MRWHLDRLDISLPHGGTHLIAGLRGQERDVDIITRLRHRDIGPTPLSCCAFGPSRLNGLMINYSNVAKEHAGAAAERLLAAMR